MRGINQKYTLTAQVLSPLHIGQGSEKDWVYGIDYLVQDGVLYHLDLAKMASAGVDINQLSACYASGKAADISHFIGSKLLQVSDFQMRIPTTTDMPIKTFLRNQLTNRPLLAGSSIKGALRSVLFAYLRDKDTKNEDVFGSLKGGTDFMRFIRVSDIEFEKTELINTKIYNLHRVDGEWEGGWKHSMREGTTSTYQPNGFNTIYECLVPDESAAGCFLLNTLCFDKLVQENDVKNLIPHLKKKQDLIDSANPIEVLCNIVNDHTFAYLDREYTFFEKYSQASYHGNILNMIGDMQDEVNNCDANECVIKMSAGSGFHAITGDWQYDDYTDTGYWEFGRDEGKKKYKSRKIAVSGENPFSLMGFVKLKFI